MPYKFIEQPMIKINRHIITCRGILFIPLLILIFISFCSKESKGKNSEVQKLYESSKPIKPLAQYSAKNPREWESIAEFHIPRVRKSKLKGQPALLIEVPLKKASFEHYIEKIGIIDKDGKEIAVKVMTRQNNPKTYAYFSLLDLSGKKNLKAFAKCNKHDMWVSDIDFDELK